MTDKPLSRVTLLKVFAYGYATAMLVNFFFDIFGISEAAQNFGFDLGKFLAI